MKTNQVAFRVTALEAGVPEGVPIEWQGRELASGPLTIELDEDSQASRGALDYSRRRAQAEFHVRLKFPEFAAMLADLGIDPALGEPVRAVLRSEGEILDDHGFALSGRCELRPHELLDHASAAVLPGH
ncbi:MAG: hypothetical protein HY238_20345 [Acidobacteria bacterium]|nr:hypothetical protein [Acidobacteriota bacterium]